MSPNTTDPARPSPSPPLVATFAAERYASTARLDALIAPPYDVITPARRSELAAQDPHNIVRLILPDGNGDRYAKAAAMLAAWRAEGVLARDDEPGVYVIRQTFTTPDGVTHHRTGVIAGVHVEPYGAGRVKPHEKTHAGPKEDRLALSRATGAMLESIFMLSRDENGSLVDRLGKVAASDPTAEGSLDGVNISCWRVTGTTAARIVEAAGSGALYIADGHHRFETANAYREVNPEATHIPTLIVPIGDPGLVVLPTHRIVRGAAIDASVVGKNWNGAFSVTRRGAGEDARALIEKVGEREARCAVVLPDRSLVIDPKQAVDGPAIVRLEREVVQPLADQAGAGSLEYSADSSEAFGAVRSGKAAAAILLNPTPVERVLAVSDAGGIMPPKSTFFSPKVPSGFVLMPYDAARR